MPSLAQSRAADPSFPNFEYANVEQVDRQRPCQGHLPIDIAGDCTGDAPPRPIALPRQGESGQVEGPFKSNAAVTERSYPLVEKLVVRRVVQVDVVGIGKVEFDLAQGVV